MKDNKYKWINKLGLTIVTKGPDSIPGIRGAELMKKLGKKNAEIFNEYFGCQTVGENGLYVYDVEAVLVRMFEGKLTGTQLFFD